MPPKKKPKQLEQQSLLFGGSRQDILRSLNSSHVGKRILLRAKDLYGGSVPKGEENVLHQYSILSINADIVSAVISYDQKCITEGGDKFRDYPLSNDDEGEIDDYKMANLNDDHELYNVHLGRVNKKINDLKEILLKGEEDAKVAAADDVSDIEHKLSDGVEPYLIMIGEFRSIGPLSMHVVVRGNNKGKSSKKQTWEHIHSGHKFVWHYAFNQNEFAKDKPWKVAREILKKSLKGSGSTLKTANPAKFCTSTKNAATKTTAARNWLQIAASGGNKYSREPSAVASSFFFLRKDDRSLCLRLTNIKK